MDLNENCARCGFVVLDTQPNCSHCGEPRNQAVSAVWPPAPKRANSAPHPPTVVGRTFTKSRSLDLWLGYIVCAICVCASLVTFVIYMWGVSPLGVLVPLIPLGALVFGYFPLRKVYPYVGRGYGFALLTFGVLVGGPLLLCLSASLLDSVMRIRI